MLFSKFFESTTTGRKMPIVSGVMRSLGSRQSKTGGIFFRPKCRWICSKTGRSRSSRLANWAILSSRRRASPLRHNRNSP